MRRSTVFFSCCGVLAAFLGLLFVHAAWKVRSDRPAVERRTMMVKYLQLTDLCLFTEARYTRHLSQSDLHSPFQDHPGGLDHFPSGSLVAPPATLRKRP
jgi:hypothetical protein